MKITRLKKGWAIRLTNSEMAVLQTTVEEVMGAPLIGWMVDGREAT